MFNKLLFSLLCITSAGMAGCSKGCMECTGITAPQEICEDDFMEKSDFQNYVSEYEDEGGICEEN